MAQSNCSKNTNLYVQHPVTKSRVCILRLTVIENNYRIHNIVTKTTEQQ